MKNKQLRRVVVFLSCLSLILYLALPVFAEDTTDTGTFLTASLPADIVASSLMNGIGVLPGQNTSEYKSIVDRCVEYLIEQGKVIDGKIEVWQREQVGDYSLWKYGVDVSMVDVIRSWIFDNGIVEYNDPNEVPPDSATDFSAAFEVAATHAYAFYITDKNGNRNTLCYSDYEITYVPAFTKIETVDGNAHIRMWNGSGWSVAQKSIFIGTGKTIHWFGTGVKPTYATSAGVELGYLSVPSLALTSAYPEWAKNSIAIPLPGALPGTDEDVQIVPFAPGQTLDDTLSIPQTDVWNGAGTLTDTPSIPGTATLSDILAAVLSIPKAIVSSITEALSKFFGINGTADSFGISLTDFFPFCIPFDIYDFLSVLSADPVAPVFHWELPVPQLGRTFEIDVDLSAWDPVAAVFRTFELLAFIVGLGMVTREKFLRS